MPEDQDQLLYLLLVGIQWIILYLTQTVTEHECKQQLLMVIQAMLENVRG